MHISELQAAVQNKDVAEELLRLLRNLNEKPAGENISVEERPSSTSYTCSASKSKKVRPNNDSKYVPRKRDA